jgi:hypothetical protein
MCVPFFCRLSFKAPSEYTEITARRDSAYSIIGLRDESTATSTVVATHMHEMMRAQWWHMQQNRCHTDRIFSGTEQERRQIRREHRFGVIEFAAFFTEPTVSRCTATTPKRAAGKRERPEQYTSQSWPLSSYAGNRAHTHCHLFRCTTTQ